MGGPARRNDLKIYDDAAARWWSDEVRWLRVLRNMVPARLRYFQRFASFSDRAVLDLGCGGGFMAEALADRGARVTGIDPASEAIAAAREHARMRDLAISYDVGVGEDLPYDDARFDACICVDVLEHVTDRARVVCEVARVLKPGGIFCFDTINRTALARLAVVTVAEDVIRLLPKGTHDPDMFIAPNDLRADLDAACFEPGPVTGLGPVGIDRRLDPTFGRLPGFTQIIYMGTARKPPA